MRGRAYAAAEEIGSRRLLPECPAVEGPDTRRFSGAPAGGVRVLLNVHTRGVIMVHATQAASPSSSVTVDISLRLGIDRAKNVFELVQVKDRSTVVFNKRLNREQLTALVMKLPPQRIVMEACATSTWWAQRFTAMLHEVLLIAPQHVRAYRQGQKNDRNDAHAIIEIGSRVSAHG